MRIQRSSLTRILLVFVSVLLFSAVRDCDTGSDDNFIWLPLVRKEKWVYKGKLYSVQTTSGGKKIWSIHSIDNPTSDPQQEPTPTEDTFRDIVDSINRTRQARSSVSGRSASAAAAPVNHFVSTFGASLRRFNPATSSIDKTVQLSCSGGTENALGLDVAQDNTVGIVATVNPGTRQRCAVVFDPATYAILAKIPLPQEAPNYNLFDAVITPDNKTAYILGYDSTVGVQFSNLYQIDLPNLTLGSTITLPQTRLSAMAMSPDGARIFLTSASVARSLYVFDVVTATLTTIPLALTDPLQVRWMAVHPYGEKLYIFNTYGNYAMDVIDTSTGAVLSQSFPFPNAAQAGFTSRSNPQFTPDGRYLLVAGDQTEIVMFDTGDDSVVQRFPPPDPTTRSGNLGFFFIPN